MAMVYDTPEKIEAFRLLSIRGRLKLESLGMKFRGGSTCAFVKREFGIKARRKVDVLAAFEDMLRAKGLIQA